MAKVNKFENAGYKINIVSRHLPMTPAIEQYIHDKLAKLEHFAGHIIDVHVTLEVQRGAHTAAIRMQFSHFKIKVSATTDDLYTAIDKATSKLIKLVKKYKTKLQSHRVKEQQKDIAMKVRVLETSPSSLEEINDQIDEENLKEEEELYKMHKIVKTDMLPLKMLTEEEAVMKLELSGEHFLIFRSEEDQKIKAIYKRPDEDLGIIQIEQ